MSVVTAIRGPLWDALRRRAQPASVPELSREVGAAADEIAWRLSRWAGAGLLVAIKPDWARHETADGIEPETVLLRTRYLMVDAQRRLPDPPALDGYGEITAKRSGRTAMWRAMRVLQRFDLVRLRTAAEVSEASAKVYVSALLRAGILRREVRGHAATSKRSIYALAGTFGPRPPVVTQRRPKNGEAGRTITAVFDPNTGTAHPISAERPLAPLF